MKLGRHLIIWKTYILGAKSYWQSKRNTRLQIHKSYMHIPASIRSWKFIPTIVPIKRIRSMGKGSKKTMARPIPDLDNSQFSVRVCMGEWYVIFSSYAHRFNSWVMGSVSSLPFSISAIAAISLFWLLPTAAFISVLVDPGWTRSFYFS